MYIDDRTLMNRSPRTVSGSVALASERPTAADRSRLQEEAISIAQKKLGRKAHAVVGRGDVLNVSGNLDELVAW